VEENLAWLSSHPDRFREIIEFHRQFRYPEIPDLDPDAALYQMGFLSQQEEKLCRRFHMVPLHEKARVAGEFSRIETRTIARRILMRNHRGAATETEKHDWIRYMERVNPREEENALLDYRGEKRTTAAAALAEIDLIRREEMIDDEQKRILEELEIYLKEKFIRQAGSKQQAATNVHAISIIPERPSESG